MKIPILFIFGLILFIYGWYTIFTKKFSLRGYRLHRTVFENYPDITGKKALLIGIALTIIGALALIISFVF